MINLRSLRQLTACRFRESLREPEVIFWVFVFPLLLAFGLGIAFRERPPEKIYVAIHNQPDAAALRDLLSRTPQIQAQIMDPAVAATALRLGKVVLALVPGPAVEYRYDPSRPDSLLARAMVDSALQNAAGRKNPLPTIERTVTEPGGRYIDFLIPGLIGMNLMGGGMWGVGFSIVDMRIKKLLKRLMATPMRKSEFMISIICSRLVFMVVEILLLLVFGYWVYGMRIQGGLLPLSVVGLFGSLSFTGMGLLVASRARRIETVSGLMNLVMLPMYVLSGIFFSADRFPPPFQPFIQALPLTALNDALRAVILEGAGLISQAGELAILAAWGILSFFLAMRWFRWN